MLYLSLISFEKHKWGKKSWMIHTEFIIQQFAYINVKYSKDLVINRFMYKCRSFSEQEINYCHFDFFSVVV